MFRSIRLRNWLIILALLALQPLIGAVMAGLLSPEFHSSLAQAAATEYKKSLVYVPVILAWNDQCGQRALSGDDPKFLDDDQRIGDLKLSRWEAGRWHGGHISQDGRRIGDNVEGENEGRVLIIKFDELESNFLTAVRNFKSNTEWTLNKQDLKPEVSEQALKDHRRKTFLQPGGLEETAREIKKVAEAILTLQRRVMEHAVEQKRRAQRQALQGACVGLAVSLLVFGLAWLTAWASLHPSPAPISPPSAPDAKASPSPRDAATDFERRFGKYLSYETRGQFILRWIFGIALLLVAAVDGRFQSVLWADALDGKMRIATDGLGVLVAIPAGIAAAWLSLLGMRAFARRGETRLRRDTRPPLLYLRSFAADNRMLDEIGVINFLLGGRAESSEELLSQAVTDLGPLVAIGQPNEWLPALGAARLYVHDQDEWQQVVRELVQVSSIVILRVGSTPGFLWEYEHVKAVCPPEKVVLLVPIPGGAMFLGFGPDWVPRLFGEEGPSFWSWIRRSFFFFRGPGVRDALKPALAQLGLPAHALPMQKREWLFLTWAILLILSVIAQLAITTGLR